VHLKFQLSRKESRGLFGGSISKHLSDWLQSVLEGLDGGEPLLKLAVCGGLLSALNDIKSEVSVKVAGKLEEELVLSFSAVLGEASAQSTNGDDDAWEREFLPRTEDAHSKHLTFSFLLCCSLVNLQNTREVECGCHSSFSLLRLCL